MFVGDAMEDLPTFTPASLACQYFCFGKGTTPGATPTFHEIARLTGAPIAGSIQAQPGSWRAPAGGSCGRLSRGRRGVAGCTGALDPPPTPAGVAVFTTSLDGNGYREVVAAVFLRRIRN